VLDLVRGAGDSVAGLDLRADPVQAIAQRAVTQQALD
jgi:hypothetical protein